MLRTLLTGLCLTLCACTDQPQISRLSGATMGTSYHIACECDAERDGLQALVDARLVRINQIMSTYDPASELSRINARQNGFPATFTTSPELAGVLRQALDLHQASTGYFDVTVGPLVNLWGFGPDASYDQVPDAAQLATARSKTGTAAISLTGKQLTLQEPRYIDLSAIAKGWAVDDIGELLETRGIHNYMVEIGGELRTRGQKADGQSWRIAIERPSAAVGTRSAELIVTPGNAAIATSGDYRNYFEVDGVRYSHTIDPFTGKPVTHHLASVTVVHQDCGLADGWATALNVAGPEKGMQLAERNHLAVFMIIRDGDRYIEKASTAFLTRFPEYRPVGQE